ncbi:hypothetical protein BKA70DRAFT_1278784 [Coprinopsis sp. MPI-PUGE-AT-0042]|nr:hypothetical protein BKA70DRAFT_1278784 [Coprinopsis sp. MPI-PUGE-AT-0042]
MPVNPPSATDNSATPPSQGSKTQTPRTSPRRRTPYDTYPGVLSDTPGGGGTLYRTGIPWVIRPANPELYAYCYEIGSVRYNHPIITQWLDFLKATAAYLTHRSIPFNTVAGVSVVIKGEKDPFLDLLVIIGVEPATVTRPEAKTAAEYWHLKPTAIDTSTSRVLHGAAIDPAGHSNYFHLMRPFTTLLSPSLSTLGNPHHEGTGGLFMHRRKADGDWEVILLTPSHLVRPTSGSQFQNDGYSSECSTEPILVISPADTACDRARQGINTILGKEADTETETPTKSLSDRIKRLEEQQGNSYDSSNQLQKLYADKAYAEKQLEWLREFDADLAKGLGDANDSKRERRVIGQVVHADPIGLGPSHCIMDWAAIQLDDVVHRQPGFHGNMLFIGNMHVKYSSACGYRHTDIDNGYACNDCVTFPSNQLFQVSSVMSEIDLKKCLKESAEDDEALLVLKDGRTTGTTLGRLNGLETLTRRYADMKEFIAIETTFVGYGGLAFSKPGDSGAIAVDAEGRAIAMITGGSGPTEECDLTYATPLHHILKRVEEVLPGYSVIPPVSP